MKEKCAFCFRFFHIRVNQHNVQSVDVNKRGYQHNAHCVDADKRR